MRNYIKEHKLEFILAPAFKAMEACFDLMVPIVMSLIIDKGIVNNDLPYILKMVGVLILLAVVGFSCTVIAQLFSARAAVGITSDIRSDLFKHIETLSEGQLQTIGQSTLITRLINDANQIQTGLNLALRLALRSPMICFGALFMCYRINKSLSLVMAILIPILFLIVFTLMFSVFPLFTANQSKLDKVLNKTRDTLNGSRVLRAFRIEQKENQQFADFNKDLYNAQSKSSVVSNLLNPLTYGLINLGIVIIIYLASPLVSSGLLLKGSLIAIYNYMGQMLVELVKLANLIINISKAIISYRRIKDVMVIEPDIKENNTITEFKDSNIAIEFENVSFKYPSSNKEALENVSFKLEAGKSLGIIGPTGSGKSTLAKLLMRNFDTTSGTIRIKGVDIKQLSLKQLRDTISLVSQKPVLFKGNIKDNMLIGKNNSDDSLLNTALNNGQVNFAGLDKEVEQNGLNFSGGQKQRLSLARVLLKNSEIIIMDDSTSALDYITEKAIQKVLEENNNTLIIISQRISNIATCDNIIVFDEANVIGQGTHQELLENCESYKQIYYTQNKKEDD